MKTISILLLCALVGISAASTPWVVSNELVGDSEAFSFKIVLQQQNLEHLDDLFWQISDPHSPLFGKHLSNEQIADLISLPEEDIQTVESYLTEKSGQVCDVTTSRNVHRDYIYVDTCVGQAKLIFPNLNVSVYENEGSDKNAIRSSILMDICENSYLLGVPHAIQHLIGSINEVTDTPVLMKHASSTFDPFAPWQSSDQELTLHNMIKYFGVTWDGIDAATYKLEEGQVRQGVIEFDGTDFSAPELEAFQKKYDLPINPIRKIVGTQSKTQAPGIEVSLDVQTITGISGNVHTWDFVFAGGLSWLDVVETIMTTENSPRVLSCSWGAWESDYDASRVGKINTAFMKLGLAGYTLFLAAGDSGPSLAKDCTKYDPEYPATSPYLVAVGGTKIDSTNGVEGAWFNSTGGFSNLNARPSYQDEKVAHYLSNAKLPPNAEGKVYTTTGRAYPDVSAFGAFQPVLAGHYQPVGGTSSATPQFAAIIALVNIHRYQNGLGPLGPLTQTLWKLEEGVGFDVTVGYSLATFNQGGNTCANKYLPGFETLAGWDPVTGLGSPRYEVLLKQLLSLPGESN